MDWDTLHLIETDCIDKALFMSEKEKYVLENVLIHYDKEEDVYFIEVDRKTEIVIDECM